MKQVGRQSLGRGAIDQISDRIPGNFYSLTLQDRAKKKKKKVYVFFVLFTSIILTILDKY